MTVPAAPGLGDVAELRTHLLASRICGDVGTSRESNVGNIRKALDGDPDYTFGLDLSGWTFEKVLALMADRVGISPDPQYVRGPDRIDADRCLEGLHALAGRLARAVAGRERVLLATGHPAGMFAVHLALAAELAARGCAVVTAGAGARFTHPLTGVARHVRHLGGVAMISNGGDLVHTHLAEPMLVMLDALDRAGEPRPDLVVADHGFAGAAGQAGIDTVGFADCNDPALFVGEADGRVGVVVPLDDNVLPGLYDPLTAFLIARLGG